MTDDEMEARSPHSITIQIPDHLEALRIMQDLMYARHRASLKPQTVALITEYSLLYEHLWSVGARVTPITNAVLVCMQMVVECKAELIRTMLLAIRGNITDAHAQIRRAIECSAWARRIFIVPELADEWLKIEPDEPPSRKWRDNIGNKLIFPADHKKLLDLRSRYQVASRFLHPFKFSFANRVELKDNGGVSSLSYSFFDAEDVQSNLPTRFFWILQTHDLILDVFEEIFASALVEDVEKPWRDHRAQVGSTFHSVARWWVEMNKRAEERRAGQEVPARE